MSDELQMRIERLSDSELVKILKYDYKDYTDDALEFAKEEFRKRNIDELTLETIEKKLTKEAGKNYAEFWLRFIAHFLDSLVLNLIILLVWVIDVFLILGFGKLLGVKNVEGSMVETIGGIINFIVITIIPWLYYALLESSSKQATIGKMTLGIIVTDIEGNRITFGRASARYWAKILSGLIFGIGYIMAGFTERKQALHDIFTNCLVIRNENRI